MKHTTKTKFSPNGNTRSIKFNEWDSFEKKEVTANCSLEAPPLQKELIKGIKRASAQNRVRILCISLPDDFIEKLPPRAGHKRGVH